MAVNTLPFPVSQMAAQAVAVEVQKAAVVKLFKVLLEEQILAAVAAVVMALACQLARV